VKEAKKVFFLEKKNQKTFVCLAPRKATQSTTLVPGAPEQKFFGSFFQKRTFFLAASTRL
jgi:hypothetical protein